MRYNVSAHTMKGLGMDVVANTNGLCATITVLGCHMPSFVRLEDRACVTGRSVCIRVFGGGAGFSGFVQHLCVAKMETPTPNIVVKSAEPTSAKTLLSISSGTKATTVSLIAVDQLIPMAHNAP